MIQQEQPVFEQEPESTDIMVRIARHRASRNGMRAILQDHISEHRQAAKRHNDEVHRAQEAMYELGLAVRPTEPVTPVKPKFYFSRRNPLVLTMVVVAVGVAVMAIGAAL
jgi:DNA-binding FrmR family transcriptional regulator